MTTHSDIDLAEKLKANDELLARGFTKEACPQCFGTGANPHFDTCQRCKGAGHIWVSPITDNMNGYPELNYIDPDIIAEWQKHYPDGPETWDTNKMLNAQLLKSIGQLTKSIEALK